jgi:hypothetical protein
MPNAGCCCISMSKSVLLSPPPPPLELPPDRRPEPPVALLAAAAPAALPVAPDPPPPLTLADLFQALLPSKSCDAPGSAPCGGGLLAPPCRRLPLTPPCAPPPPTKPFSRGFSPNRTVKYDNMCMVSLVASRSITSPATCNTDVCCVGQQ